MYYQFFGFGRRQTSSQQNQQLDFTSQESIQLRYMYTMDLTLIGFWPDRRSFFFAICHRQNLAPICTQDRDRLTTYDS